MDGCYGMGLVELLGEGVVGGVGDEGDGVRC